MVVQKPEVKLAIAKLRPNVLDELSNEIGLIELVRTFMGRKWLLFSIVTFVMVSTILTLRLITPLYTSTALVIIRSQSDNIPNLDNILTGLGVDSEAVNSEIEILQSDELINKVIERLELRKSHEFNDALRPKGFPAVLASVNRFTIYLPPEWRDVILGIMNEQLSKLAKPTKEEPGEIDLARVRRNLRSRLEVAPKGRSRVVSVSFTSEVPKLAAEFVEVLTEEYITAQLLARFNAAQQAVKLLNNSVEVLRKRAEKSEEIVEKFRNEQGLIGVRRGGDVGESHDLVSQQLKEVSRRIVSVRAKRDIEREKLSEVRMLLNQPNGVRLAAQILESSLLRVLKEQFANLERRKAELSTVYGANHPTTLNILAEYKKLKSNITAEVKEIINKIENDVILVSKEYKTLVENLSALKRRAAKNNQSMIRLRSLERDSDSDREILETFLIRFKESQLRDSMSFQQANARVISHASVPETPSYPRRTMTLFGAGIGGIFLGALIILIVEQLRSGFRSSQEIFDATGWRVRALIPEFTGTKLKKRYLATYLVRNPLSMAAEAFRTLYTSIKISSGDAPLKTILVTSSVPNEGKSTTVSCIAVMRALAGDKVLVIDADLREPTQHKIFNVSREPGLSSVLAGDNMDAENLIVRHEETGVYVIPAGSIRADAFDLTDNKYISKLISVLKTQFDLILVDSPPVSAVSDALILNQIVDCTILAVRWAKTSRKAVQGCLNRITLPGEELSGIVLTMVNVKKYAKYDYTDSGYFHGNNTKYYSR